MLGNLRTRLLQRASRIALLAAAADAHRGPAPQLSGTVEFETSSKARVAIPSDVDPFRLVLLNETCGTARVTGSTAAGAVDFAGPSIMEFVRG